MSFTDQDNREEYSGDAVSTVFSFPHPTQISTDLKVYLIDEDDLSETLQTITTHYTVTLAADFTSASVTFLTAPGTDKQVVIYRDPPKTQTLDLGTADALPSDELEERLDKLTMLILRLSDRIDRTVSLSNAVVGFDPTLPTGLEADDLIGVNPTATGLIAIQQEAFTFSTSAPTTTKGDLIVHDGSSNVRFAVGANDSILVADSAQTKGVKYTATVPRSTLPLTTKGDLFTDTGSANARLAVGSNLQALIADSAVTNGLRYQTMTMSKQIINYSLAASVASSALTLALKDASGSDASATSPVIVAFRNSTLATGTPSVVLVTAALSTVISSGSTAGHASAVADYVHWYLINNAGTGELAWCTNGGLDEGALWTTTAEGGAGAADSRTVLYSTTARSNVAIRYIGRMLSNQTTAGTWAAVPTEISLSQAPTGIEENEVWYTGGAGEGSTATAVREYVTLVRAVGTAMTTTNDSTNGMKVTVQKPGLFAIFSRDGDANAGSIWAPTVNAASVTATVNGFSTAETPFGVAYNNPANINTGIGGLIFLKTGDIVRVQDQNAGDLDMTNDKQVVFRMQKVSI